MLVNNLAFILSLFVPLLCPSNPLFLPFPAVLITPDIISSVIEENRLAIMRIKEISSQGQFLSPVAALPTAHCLLGMGVNRAVQLFIYCLCEDCALCLHSTQRNTEK